MPKISIPLIMTRLSNVMPFATGNLRACTRRLRLTNLHVKFFDVIKLPENRPKASSLSMKNSVESLIKARLPFAERSWSCMCPRCVSVFSSSIHDTYVCSVNIILAEKIPVLKTWNGGFKNQTLWKRRCINLDSLRFHANRGENLKWKM